MADRTTHYMTLAHPDQVYVPVELNRNEFDLLFYQFKNNKGEIYEMRFWEKDLFEVILPDGEVIHATWEIGEFEGNPFPNYENGKLWEWIKIVLLIHSTKIEPIIKRYRYIHSQE
jgi:hypothetical protein